MIGSGLTETPPGVSRPWLHTASPLGRCTPWRRARYASPASPCSSLLREVQGRTERPRTRRPRRAAPKARTPAFAPPRAHVSSARLSRFWGGCGRSQRGQRSSWLRVKSAEASPRRSAWRGADSPSALPMTASGACARPTAVAAGFLLPGRNWSAWLPRALSTTWLGKLVRPYRLASPGAKSTVE